jgi:hypothetical protein
MPGRQQQMVTTRVMDLTPLMLEAGLTRVKEEC